MQIKMIQYTSLLAFMTEKKAFMTREQQVLTILKSRAEGLSDSEIMFNLGYKIPNMVRPRRHELYKKGLVKCIGTRKCSITNKLVKVWKAK